MVPVPDLAWLSNCKTGGGPLGKLELELKLGNWNWTPLGRETGHPNEGGMWVGPGHTESAPTSAPSTGCLLSLLPCG